METQIEVEIDFDKIPLVKKLIDKNWKIKQRGFEDLKKLFETAQTNEVFQ